MEDFTWTTEAPHANNQETMTDFINNHCELEITTVDGTYAEGLSETGSKWAIHAQGNGDFCNHRITFEQL